MFIKPFLLLICLILTISNCLAQNSSYNFFFLQSGTKYFTGMESFNNGLKLQNHNAMNKLGIINNLGMGTRINRAKISIGANIIVLLNKSNENHKPITCHETTITAEFSYDLIKKQELTLEPVIGLGFGVAGIRIPEIDSTYSFEQVLGGSQNQYFSETKFNWLLNVGIKFGDINARGLKKSVYPEIQVGYIAYLNQFKWNIAEMPLSKLNGCYAQIGLIYRLCERQK